MNSQITSEKDEEEEVELPGFRFHPTDEELVGFYLRRKVDKKPLSIQLIKQVDIYKYDPWELPKSSGVGEKEGYFFCKRGRKYRNSVRPNRVTGSGFWKATGIDKPVYSNAGEGRDCIGLKKTLVYYRGSAGKGTKTDWMMHEFRLPSNETTNTNTNIASAKISTQLEAEVWTLCRIFKRNVSYRKYTPDWRELANKRQPAAGVERAITSNNYKTCSAVDSNNYMSFGDAPLFMIQHSDTDNKKAVVSAQYYGDFHERKAMLQEESAAHQPPSVASSSSNNISSGTTAYGNDHQLLSYGDWDELRSVVDFAFDSSLL